MSPSYKPYGANGKVWAKLLKDYDADSIRDILLIWQREKRYETLICESTGLTRWALRQACKKLSVKLADGREEASDDSNLSG